MTMNDIHYLIKILRRVHRRQSLVEFTGIFLLFLAVSILILLVTLFFFKSPWYLLIGLAVFPLYRAVGFMDRVRAVDRQCGLNGSLINSVQFLRYSGKNREGYSQELIRAYIDRSVKFINIDLLRGLIDWKPLIAGSQILLISVIMFLLYPAVFPARFAFSIDPRIEWIVIPGSTSSVENTGRDISLIVNGVYVPGKVRLIRQENNRSISALVAVKNGQAKTSLIVKRSFKYHFEFLNRKTASHQITMTTPVMITDLEFRLDYPAYTGLKPETKTGRQIIAPQNTRVTMNGHANQILQKASMIYGDTVQLICKENLFQGEFKIRHSGTAHIRLDALSSLEEAISVYSIPDLAPLVDIFLPGQNVNMPDGMILGIGVRLSDDYGLSAGRFGYDFKRTEHKALSLRRGATEDTLFFNWNLAELNLLPGDEISYYVEITDNAGNKTRSSTYYVYFPTMEQMYAAIHREEDALAGALDRSLEEQDKHARELGRIEQNLLKNRELAWGDQEKLRELLRRDKALLEQIEDWQSELERTIDKINEGLILDPKALSNLQELWRLLDEIAPQELRAAIEKLEQQFEKNPGKPEDMIKHLKQHQKELTQALARTLEILKRYQQEERLRQLAQIARDLARQADSLSAGTGDLDDQAIGDLREKVQELARETSRLAASRDLEENIQASLSAIAEQLELTAGSDEMTAMSASLNMSAADLEKLYEELVKGRGAELQANLYRILDQLIAISHQQEDLFTRPGDHKFDYELQDQIAGSTRAVAESLFSGEKRSLYITPTMGKRIARAAGLMDRAKTESNERGLMQEAVQSINQVAVELFKNLEQAAAGKTSTGADRLMEQLAGISKGQFSINQSTASLLPLPVTGMSPGIKEQMQRLAGSQRKIRQALSDLQLEAGSEPYQDLLKKLTEDVQAVEEDLFQYKLDRQLIERQQQILTRLLDAERSIRREDFEEKRKSKTGQDIAAEPPLPLPGRLGKNELRDLLNQALKEAYPREYEIYIREYFERLPDLK